jgi:hypothetical protein
MLQKKQQFLQSMDLRSQCWAQVIERRGQTWGIPLGRGSREKQ